jgi:hypothetical protein
MRRLISPARSTTRTRCDRQGCRRGISRAALARRRLRPPAGLAAAVLAAAGALASPAGPAVFGAPASPPASTGSGAADPASVAAPGASAGPAASAAPAAASAAPAAVAGPQPDPQAWRAAAAAAGPLSAAELRQRRRRYLELALHQMHRLEQIEQRLDTQRLGAGALAAAALRPAGSAGNDRSAGRPAGSAGDDRPAGRPGGSAGNDGPGGRPAGGSAAGEGRAQAAESGAGGDAARWVEQLLEDCNGNWERVACARAELSLQRIVLRLPRALPPPLLARARAAAADAAPPPAAAETAAPWSFGDTENQRAVLMARSLVAAVVAGAPDAAAARAWGDHAAAFLAAHDRDGWYEAESPGYMAISITALLHLADLAPQARVRDLARRELDLLFAAWAQQQVAGYPAGPRSRTYVQWALGDRTTPWRAWAWLAAAVGDAGRLAFSDWPELALGDYEVPSPVAQLLRERRSQPPYEILARRRIATGGRAGLDAALYSYATPDYILGVAQAVGGLRLAVSGGEEIVATLYPEAGEFAPLYLWSRTRNTPADRWKSWADQDLAVGARSRLVAYLGAGDAAAAGHAFLAAPWSRPEVVGEARETVVSWCGDAYVALTTEGGWEVAPAPRKFPDYYGGAFADSWVAVPLRQPAAIGLEAGRRAEDGDLAAWRRRASRATLRREGPRLRFAPGGGAPALDYLPGERAAIDGAPLRPGAYPLLAGPFLASSERGVWELAFGAVRQRFAVLPAGR